MIRLFWSAQKNRGIKTRYWVIQGAIEPWCVLNQRVLWCANLEILQDSLLVCCLSACLIAGGFSGVTNPNASWQIDPVGLKTCLNREQADHISLFPVWTLNLKFTAPPHTLPGTHTKFLEEMAIKDWVTCIRIGLILQAALQSSYWPPGRTAGTLEACQVENGWSML